MRLGDADGRRLHARHRQRGFVDLDLRLNDGAALADLDYSLLAPSPVA